MKPDQRAALDAYYAEADSWARDRDDARERSRRTAWRIAAAAAAVAVLEALALVILGPLRTVVPYTLLVDRQTGYVQLLKPLDPARVGADTALTQSFLVQYVIAREGYDIATVQSDYRKVALWSAGDARAAYIAAMQPSNANSPLNRLPRTSTLEVRVKSVSPLGPDTAMVRYDLTRHDAGGGDGVAQPMVAILTYRYSGAPMSIADRLVNPLGFNVTHYRTNVELLPQPVAAPVAPVNPAAMVGP